MAPCEQTPTLLIDPADAVATMNHAGDEWSDASVLIEGHRIAWGGPAAELQPTCS